MGIDQEYLICEHCGFDQTVVSFEELGDGHYRCGRCGHVTHDNRSPFQPRGEG